MVKDTLNSIFDNIKERTTNPFLGTLVVVWVIHNWKLVYSLFYFDGNFKLNDRLLYIDKSFEGTSFTFNLFIVVFITVLVLVLTYCMLALSRLITDAYDKIVLPYLSKLTDKTSIVTKTQYMALEEVVKNLESKLEVERLGRISAQDERDKAYLKLVNNGREVLPDQRQQKIVEEALTSIDDKEVNSIIVSIQSGKRMLLNRTLNVFLQYDLLTVGSKSLDGTSTFSFNNEGKEFLKYWNNRNIQESSIV